MGLFSLPQFSLPVPLVTPEVRRDISPSPEVRGVMGVRVDSLDKGFRHILRTEALLPKVAEELQTQSREKAGVNPDQDRDALRTVASNMVVRDAAQTLSPEDEARLRLNQVFDGRIYTEAVPGADSPTSAPDELSTAQMSVVPNHPEGSVSEDEARALLDQVFDSVPREDAHNQSLAV